MNDPSQWSTIRFYQETTPSDKSQNRLPHWQQDGGTYFVTFRLADALPSELIKKWSEDRKVWLLQNPKPWNAVKELEYHRKFSGELDRHLDKSHGSCLLRDRANAAILAESLRHFDRERYLLHAWVIMPNHVHLLFSMASGGALEKVVAGWKRFFANQIQKRTGNTGGI